MMNYGDFKEYIKENILGELPDIYSEFEVNIRKSMKNNGMELDGLCIHGHDNISPVIYLNGYYEKYNDGASLKSIMSEISECYINNVEHRGLTNDIAENVMSYENIKGNIFSKLVNTKNNEYMLSERPHTEYEDLSVTYHIMVSKDENGIASIPISNDMAKAYGVTAEELDQVARDNMSKDNPMVIRSIGEIMREMIMPDMFDDAMSKEQAEEMFDEMFPINDDMKMYVLSNESKVNGAIWMTSPEALEALSEKIGGDFFILPSSIHEVIAVPNDGHGERELQDMVMSVNQDQVSLEDRLSDNVYSYDAKEHKLSLATGDKTLSQDMEQEHTLEEEKKHSGVKH